MAFRIHESVAINHEEEELSPLEKDLYWKQLNHHIDECIYIKRLRNYQEVVKYCCNSMKGNDIFSKLSFG